MTADLIKKTNLLVDEQEKLIKKILEKHREAYAWLQKNKVLLREVWKYAENVAALAILAFGLPFSPIRAVEVNASEQKESYVQLMNSDRLRNLDADEKRAMEVWIMYEPYILEASTKYDLDPKVIFATIMVESGGNTKAIRYEPSIGDASYGLGQMLYGTARLVGFEGKAADLFDPKENIDLVAKYHRRNLEVYGELTVEQLATAYNAGSPYSRPTYGHVAKFKKWFDILGNLVKS